MSNDFILNSDIISVFKKNGVVLLKNMIENKWQRIILDAIEEDIKKQNDMNIHRNQGFLKRQIKGVRE